MTLRSANTECNSRLDVAINQCVFGVVDLKEHFLCKNFQPMRSIKQDRPLAEWPVLQAPTPTGATKTREREQDQRMKEIEHSTFTPAVPRYYQSREEWEDRLLQAISRNDMQKEDTPYSKTLIRCQPRTRPHSRKGAWKGLHAHASRFPENLG